MGVLIFLRHRSWPEAETRATPFFPKTKASMVVSSICEHIKGNEISRRYFKLPSIASKNESSPLHDTAETYFESNERKMEERLEGKSDFQTSSHESLSALNPEGFCVKLSIFCCNVTPHYLLFFSRFAFFFDLDFLGIGRFIIFRAKVFFYFFV